MSSPQTNIERQKQRHRWPLIGMAAVVILGVGLILFWIGEEFVSAPGPDESSGAVAPADIRDGAAEVPAGRPTEDVAPGDPDVQVKP